jgi:hypothetical protein
MWFRMVELHVCFMDTNEIVILLIVNYYWNGFIQKSWSVQCVLDWGEITWITYIIADGEKWRETRSVSLVFQALETLTEV